MKPAHEWALIHHAKPGDPYRIVARYESASQAWDEAYRQTVYGNPGYWSAAKIEVVTTR